VITADTITDEQIHDLRRTLAREQRDPNHPNYDRSHGLFGPGGDIQACWDANNGSLAERMPEHVRECRARCAEILNARAEGK
jgi:hypothetical protein